ncbi:MAG: hypothetical protein Q8N39_06145 [Pelolinea sp.]|nr:hypothetical protein [Pelolinea sp.]
MLTESRKTAVNKEWDLIIQPQRRLLHQHLSELWHYCDLRFLVQFGVTLLMYALQSSIEVGKEPIAS